MGVEVHPLRRSGVIMMFWDTAGQEKLSGLTSGYYIDADAAIYVYDNTVGESRANLGHWAADVAQVCGVIPSVVVRNKCDLVDQTEGGVDNEMRVSCRTGEGVVELLGAVLGLLL